MPKKEKDTPWSPKPKHVPHGPTIEHWLKPKHGEIEWKTAQILAEETESDPIFLSPDQHVILLSRCFDDDGNSIQGHHQPHVKVHETTDGAVITARQPVYENTTFLFKIVDDPEEEDDEEPLPIPEPEIPPSG